MAEIPGSVPKKGLRRRDKILIGCAVGCGGLVILAGLAFFGGLYWLVSPGDQIATERILSDEAVGYVRLPDPGEDPGLTDLLTTFIVEADRVSRSAAEEELPGFFQQYQEMNLRNGAKGMCMWIPSDSTISFERTADGDETAGVAAVNLRSFPRAVRSFISALADGGTEEYRGREIIDMGDGDTFVAFYGTTLLGSSSEALVKRVIDRLEDGARPPADLDFGQSPSEEAAEPAQRWDAFGAFDGESDVPAGILTALLDYLPPSELVEDDLELRLEALDVTSLRFGLDVVTANTLRGGLSLDFETEDSAGRWARRFTGQGPVTLGDYEVAVEMSSVRNGPQVQADFELTGLEGLLVHILEQTEQGAYDETYDYEEEEYGDEETYGEEETYEDSAVAGELTAEDAAAEPPPP